MNLITHGAYLTQLSQFRFINQYLVQEDDGLTLIDTGARGQSGSHSESGGQPERSHSAHPAYART